MGTRTSRSNLETVIPSPMLILLAADGKLESAKVVHDCPKQCVPETVHEKGNICNVRSSLNNIMISSLCPFSLCLI